MEPERRLRCVTCTRSVTRDRNRHVLTMEYMEPRPGFTNYVLAQINRQEQVNLEAVENEFICYRCWVAANREEARYIEQRVDDNDLSHTITVPTYKRLANTSRRCLFLGCHNTERHRVPYFIKLHLLTEHSLYVPQEARICREHMLSNNWSELYETAETVFTPQQLKDIFDTLRDAYINKTGIDFENLQSISTEELYFRTGLTHEQFDTVLNETPSLLNENNHKTILGAYLMKLRSGEPDVRIACFLNMSRWILGRYIKKARQCLATEFVVRHLGLEHISREEIIRHSLTVPTALFGDGNNKAILFLDGTYIYIQKSQNFMFQKSTYSLHKFRNLLKPFVIVCPDGYIIDILGPYVATASDAQIMTQLMSDESPLHGLLHANDVFILDRGFRNSLERVETCGYEQHMPPTKARDATQLTVQEANESRKVTIVRWVIEVINGWFKRDFKIFRNQVFNKSLPHLFTDFRIAGALLNAFRERLCDSDYASAFVERINRSMNTNNHLGNYVVENNLNRQRASFVTLTDESINGHSQF